MERDPINSESTSVDTAMRRVDANVKDAWWQDSEAIGTFEEVGKIVVAAGQWAPEPGWLRSRADRCCMIIGVVRSLQLNHGGRAVPLGRVQQSFDFWNETRVRDDELFKLEREGYLVLLAGDPMKWYHRGSSIQREDGTVVGYVGLPGCRPWSNDE